MSHVRLWRFRPAAGRAAEFERAYGPDGGWARLFRRGDGYLGTELLHPAGPGGAYVTVDRWRTEDDWRAFRAEHDDAYRRLDRELSGLCAMEEEIGNFSSADGPPAT